MENTTIQQSLEHLSQECIGTAHSQREAARLLASSWPASQRLTLYREWVLQFGADRRKEINQGIVAFCKLTLPSGLRTLSSEKL